MKKKNQTKKEIPRLTAKQVLQGQEKVPMSLIIVALVLAIWGAVSVSGFSLIGALIGFACGSKCYKWAREIGSKGNLAFFIGFFFGLLGLLFYYIYYSTQTKKKSIPKKKTIKPSWSFDWK